MQNTKRITISGLLIVSLLLGLLNTPIVSAVTFAIEDFEDDSVGSFPTGSFYTQSNSGANNFVGSEQAFSGVHSWKKASTALGVNLNSPYNIYSGAGNDFDVKFYMGSLGSGSAFELDESTDGRCGITSLAYSGDVDCLQITSGGAAVIHGYRANGSQTCTTTLTGLTIVINRWYDLHWSYENVNPLSGAASGIITISIRDTTTGIITSGSCSAGAVLAGRNGHNFAATSAFNGVSNNAAPIWLDDVSIGSVPLTTVSIPETNLVGFDTLRYGDYVIARTNGGDFVRPYNGDSLIASATAISTSCARSHGVFGIGTDGFGYFSCTAGTLDNLVLIDQFGNPYDISPCDGACPSRTISLSSFANEGHYLDAVMPFGNDKEYSISPTDKGHEFNVFVSGDTGDLYDLSFGLNEAGGSNFLTKEEDTTSYATTPVEGICSYQQNLQSSANAQVYAVDSVTQTKGYQITDSIIPPNYSATTTQNFAGTTLVNLANDISCSNNGLQKILVGKSTSLVLLNPITGVPIWTKTGIIGLLKVSLSGDGKWASYSDAANTYILNATSGSALTTIANPAGTLVDTEIDYFGQKQFIATSGFLQMTVITPVTTASSVGPGISSTTTTTTASSSTCSTTPGSICTTITNPFHASDDNPFGLNITYISTQLHVSHEGVAVMIGLIFVVIFTIWLWRGTGSPLIALLGAGLGLVVATLFGFINVWVIMVVVLFLIVMLGKMIFGGFTGGEES